MGRRQFRNKPRPTVHKRSGMARLRIAGREYWLGKAGTREADERYHQHLTAWVASGGKSADLPEPAAPAATLAATVPANPRPPSDSLLTVGSLVLRYVTEVKGVRTKAELRNCSKWWNVRLVDNALRTRSAVPIDLFGPKMLKDVQAELATRPRQAKREGEKVMRTRYMVNRIVKEIVAMFAWGVAEELVSPHKLTALQCVKGLRAGESMARESEGRKPAPDAHVEAIYPFLPPVMADLVRFARLTAVRPTEACRLRLADVDFSPDLPAPKWTLPQHKTAHKGKVREVAIGPRARKLVERWAAGKSPTDPVFAVGDLDRVKTEGTIAKRRRRKAAAMFTSENIRKDVAAACKAAGVPKFTPYQLRHAGITQARLEHGLEAAKAHGGQATIAMARHYSTSAEFFEKARVAEKIG